MKIWIATAVDHGETCDGKARILAAYLTENEAACYIRSDMEEWADRNAGEDVTVDFDKMRAYFNYDTSEGCEWNVEPTDLA